MCEFVVWESSGKMSEFSMMVVERLKSLECRMSYIEAKLVDASRQKEYIFQRKNTFEYIWKKTTKHEKNLDIFFNCLYNFFNSYSLFCT